MAITISRGTLADLDTVIAHRRAMFEEMGHRPSPSLDLAMANSRIFVQKMLAEGRYHIWLAKNAQGQVVGGAGLTIYEWSPHPDTPAEFHRPLVKNVYITPAYRRQGIARLLMDAIITFCRTAEYTQLWLHASEGGRPLYEAMGFTATNEMRLKL